LISYQPNFYHTKKTGDTCLHECVLRDSIDCLLILASYCGDDLFEIINKDGYRAIDLALKKQRIKGA